MALIKKLGLDYHGCITDNPKLFSELTKIVRGFGYEVHIITGTRITEAFEEKLKEYDIAYTHLFSISDYHYHLGTEMSGYAEHQPKIEEDAWDKTKAKYCRDNGILLHIDDSEVYGQYFTTPYLLYRKGSDGQVIAEVLNGATSIHNLL